MVDDGVEGERVALRPGRGWMLDLFAVAVVFVIVAVVSFDICSISIAM